MVDGVPMTVSGTGNGPIAAFVGALDAVTDDGLDVVDYSEHSLGVGADAVAWPTSRPRRPTAPFAGGWGPTPTSSPPRSRPCSPRSTVARRPRRPGRAEPSGGAELVELTPVPPLGVGPGVLMSRLLVGLEERVELDLGGLLEEGPHVHDPAGVVDLPDLDAVDHGCDAFDETLVRMSTTASSPPVTIRSGTRVHSRPGRKELSQEPSAATRPCLGALPTGSSNTTSSA